jgi:hypothetical protein
MRGDGRIYHPSLAARLLAWLFVRSGLWDWWLRRSLTRLWNGEPNYVPRLLGRAFEKAMTAHRMELEEHPGEIL